MDPNQLPGVKPNQAAEGEFDMSERFCHSRSAAYLNGHRATIYEAPETRQGRFLKTAIGASKELSTYHRLEVIA